MMSRGAIAALLMSMLSACAAAPPAPVDVPVVAVVPDVRQDPPPPAPEPVRIIESPPIEPVAAPPTRLAAGVEPSPPLPDRNAQVAVIPPPEPVVPAAPPPPQVIIAEPSAEEREFVALLGDLQRYTTLNADELRRETQAMTQAIARGRSDANRVRLAVLYTLTRGSAQDDQRALQLFDTVAKSNPASASIKQLATVLSVQVAERVRAVRDEQARSEAALQKLEALRAMERSLLRDRVRSGGGGGGAGSGGGN
jgi:hypothetical protein